MTLYPMCPYFQQPEIFPMKLTQKRAALVIAGAALATLYGCGGGSSDAGVATGTPTVATSLPGTAAIGAPITGSVFAIDVNGRISPAVTTSAGGGFIVDVGGMTAPYILSITGTAGGRLVTLNSIATAAGQTVNITPLTDLIVSTALGRPGGSALTNLCAPVNQVVPADCVSALASVATTPARLTSATEAVMAIIAPLNLTGINPLTGALVADGTGMDKILDQILMTPADAQGAMATITLIATNTSLGTVTLPPTAGAGATTAAIEPSGPELSKATAGAAVLPEIRACLAALNALYPKTGFQAPSSQAVTPFVDSTFLLGQGEDSAAIVAALTDTSELAIPGLTIEATGLSPYDMSPLSSQEIGTLTDVNSTSTTRVADFIENRRTAGATAITFVNGAPTSAWVQLRIAGDASVNNWKMVKTTDTSGCAGGWKLAGSGHLDMHMNARIGRSIDTAGAATFSRQWAFHLDQATLTDQNTNSATFNKVDVRGPGLTDFGDYSTNITTGRKLQLMMPQAGNTAMRFDNSDGPGTGSTFYVNAEALQSCQDLASISPRPGTLGDRTPCIDESKVAPGKVYVWTLKAAGVPLIAFPFQISAVPLSKAFVQANQASLFATLTSRTPSTFSALTALANTLLDGRVTFNYTQSTTYGSKMDNCSLYLRNGSVQVLSAEQNAVGQETSCTFTTDGLNSLASESSLFNFATATSGTIGLATSVLGNQAVSSQPYAN